MPLMDVVEKRDSVALLNAPFQQRGWETDVEGIQARLERKCSPKVAYLHVKSIFSENALPLLMGPIGMWDRQCSWFGSQQDFIQHDLSTIIDH